MRNLRILIKNLKLKVVKIQELLEKESIKIENMIYEIRGKQVMLDSDLAKLFNVKTK